MIAHLIKSINWVDAALVILFVRIIFVGIKNGFISEFFKLLGTVTAVFVSLHFYRYLAALAEAKTKISWPYWDLVMFLLLWLAVLFCFRYIREGVLILFKVEANHQGFDKYAAGVLATARGILVCSLAIFLVLLINNGPLTRMTIHSDGYKIAGRASVGTYSFLYNNLVDKFFPGAHYNTAASEVLHPKQKGTL